MQAVNMTFGKYPITLESPDILKFNETTIIYLEFKNDHSVNIKDFVKKLMKTIKCFLFSMKKQSGSKKIMYELVVYKMKNPGKSWGYWKTKQTELIDIKKNNWAYWNNYRKEQNLNIYKSIW
jgi:hypothetical protein